MGLSSKLSLHRFGSPKERLSALAEEGWLDLEAWSGVSDLSESAWSGILDGTVENVVETFRMPLSVATGFVVNGNDRLVPIVTEERTVVAAASKAAKLCRPNGFTVKVRPAIAIAQLLYPRPTDPDAAERVNGLAGRLVRTLHRDDRMSARGGGPLSVGARLAESERGELLIVEARIDVRDAMGANAATETGHRLGALLREEMGELPLAVICGNDVPERHAVVRAVWRAAELGADLAKRSKHAVSDSARAELGREGIRRLLDLQGWAEADPARAVTHMKGVMNGVTAVGLATGQDTRALEAAVWAESCRGGACRPLTSYKLTSTGDLYGVLRIPIVAGTVGGATGHPSARVGRMFAGVADAKSLVETMAAAGLAQNFAALWSLAHEGIIASQDKLGRTKAR